MNKPRQKGTRYEVELLPRLRQVFGPQVERAPLKGIHDEGDFTGVPIPVEAKNTKTLLIPEWVRRLRGIGSPWWVLFHSGGDRRRAGGTGELAVMPAEMARWLLFQYASLIENDVALPWWGEHQDDAL